MLHNFFKTGSIFGGLGGAEKFAKGGSLAQMYPDHEKYYRLFYDKSKANYEKFMELVKKDDSLSEYTAHEWWEDRNIEEDDEKAEYASGGSLAQKNKVARVMHEFKEGKLKSSSGDLVTDRQQAIAIALSSAGLSKYSNGGYVTSIKSFNLPASDVTPIGLGGIPNYNTPLDVNELNEEMNYEKGGGVGLGKLRDTVYEVVEIDNGNSQWKIIGKHNSFDEYIKAKKARSPYIDTNDWRIGKVLFNLNEFDRNNVLNYVPDLKVSDIYDKYAKGGGISDTGENEGDWLEDKFEDGGRVYKLGDKYSNDFDYEGMLEFGSTATIELGEEKLEKLHRSFEDVNYHTAGRPLWAAVKLLEAGNEDEAKQKMVEFNIICKEEIIEMNTPDTSFEKGGGIDEFKSRERRGVALVKATSWRSQKKLDNYKMVDRKNKLAIYEVPKKHLERILSYAGVSQIERKNKPVRFSLENGGGIGSRIASMIKSWNEEGRAWSSLSQNDDEFFEKIGLSYMEVGVTSQTGNDLLYFDTNLYSSDDSAIKGRVDAIENVAQKLKSGEMFSKYGMELAGAYSFSKEAYDHKTNVNRNSSFNGTALLVVDAPNYYVFTRSSKFASGGALSGEWVLYDSSTGDVISTHKSHRSAKMAMDKAWSNDDYKSLTIEAKSEFDKWHKLEDGGFIDAYPSEIKWKGIRPKNWNTYYDIWDELTISGRKRFLESSKDEIEKYAKVDKGEFEKILGTNYRTAKKELLSKAQIYAWLVFKKYQYSRAQTNVWNGKKEDGGSVIEGFRLPASDVSPIGQGGIPNYNTPLDVNVLNEEMIYAKGGGLYDVVKRGEDEDLGNRLMSAKNLKELEQKIIAKYGTKEGISVSKRSKATGAFYPCSLEEGGGVESKRKMYLHDAVLYKGELYYISLKNGVLGLENLKQGAWGMDYPFTPIGKINMDDITDMMGRKVSIEEMRKGGSISEDLLMAKSDVLKLEEYAKKISDSISPSQEVDAWVISKISKVEQTTANVKHTLEAEYPKMFAVGGKIDNADGNTVRMMCLHIGKYAKSLLKALESGVVLDSWMKHELSIAGSMIDSVFHYLDYSNSGNHLAKGGGVAQKYKWIEAGNDWKRTNEYSEKEFEVVYDKYKNDSALEAELDSEAGKTFVNKNNGEKIYFSRKYDFSDGGFKKGGNLKANDLRVGSFIKHKRTGVVVNVSEVNPNTGLMRLERDGVKFPKWYSAKDYEFVNN